MKKVFVFLFCVIVLNSCSEDEVIQTIENPVDYTFTRNGESTVDFSEQTTLLAMLEELSVAVVDNSNSEASLLSMFDHQEGVSDFTDANLNSSDKSIKNSVASSVDYYYLNESDGTEIQEEFEEWITEQATDIFPNYLVNATAGNAGNIVDVEENTTRYVNGFGVEVSEVFYKGLIGGLIVDQILNNYLSSSILDTDNNVQDNDDNVLVEGESYTAMEHGWDEAYGFLYGGDNYLIDVINEADTDSDFTGIADDIFNAFKLGRAAIVAKDYDEREDQAEIIKEKISLAIAIKIVMNFKSSQVLLEETTLDYGAIFHEISEGLGFVYTLQFTRKPLTTSSPTPYTIKDNVEEYFSELLDVGNGLWESATSGNLQEVLEDIETDFGYEEDELLDLLSN